MLPGGLLLRGLSGGERRRLSVAIGILASPSILFLDGGWGGPWFLVIEFSDALDLARAHNRARITAAA